VCPFPVHDVAMVEYRGEAGSCWAISISHMPCRGAVRCVKDWQAQAAAEAAAGVRQCNRWKCGSRVSLHPLRGTGKLCGTARTSKLWVQANQCFQHFSSHLTWT
jgi:hypothetical protein